MPLAEVIHGESGDDRDSDVLLQRAREVYYGTDTIGAGIGDIILKETVGIPNGRATLQRAHLRFAQRPPINN